MNLQLRQDQEVECDRLRTRLRKEVSTLERAFVGSWDMPFGFHRASTRVDPVSGAALEPAALVAVAHCSELEYDGRFLQLMGMADLRTGHMAVFGGLDVSVLGREPVAPPAAAGSVTFSRGATAVTATIAGGELAKEAHVFSIPLVDGTSGEPLPLYHTKRTHVTADTEGHVREMRVEFGDSGVPPSVRAYYLVDTHALAYAEL